MSKPGIKRKLATNLRNAISSKRTQQLRQILQDSQRANILFLDNLDFIQDTLNKLLEEGVVTPQQVTGSNMSFNYDRNTKTVSLKITAEQLKQARAIAQAAEDRFKRSIRDEEGAAKINGLIQRDPTVKDKFSSVNKSAFLIRNFDAGTSIKYEIVSLILKSFQGTESLIKKVSAGVQKGHGTAGGTAIAFDSIAEVLGAAQKARSFTEEEIENLQTYIFENLSLSGINVDKAAQNDIKDITVNWDKIVNKKTATVSDEYLPYITFQDAYSNRVDSIREKRVLNLVREWVVENVTGKSLAELRGSPSLKERMITVAFSPLIDTRIKFKNVTKKVKLDKKYTVPTSQLSSKGSVVSKGTEKRPSNKAITKAPRVHKPLRMPGPTKTRPMAKQGFNQLQLVGILNASLPPIVRKNMQYPALQNRTGLFSESVKVTSIDQTPKGFPSISYTYDKIPYQVFEMGIGKSPWATPERDPRKLIDKSVRELAAEYMGQRFYTKRV